LRRFSAHAVLAQDAVHDVALLCDEGILPLIIAHQTTFSLGLDPALKLGACLRTYVSHALVILSHDSRPFLRGRGSLECGVLRGLDIVDEGEAEFGFDVVFERVYPWFRGGTGCGERWWQSRLTFARGKGERGCWGLVK